MKPLFGLSFCALLLTSAWVYADEVPAAIPESIVVSTPVAVSTPVVVAVEPYRCPLSKCVVISKFGSRTPLNTAMSERHKGIDFRATPGQAVRAARSGRVIFAGFSKEYVSREDKKQQERLVIIVHADRQSSRYVHLNTLAVKPPQMVQAGDVIGTAAESDEWTEPVVHFEIHSTGGAPINPERYVKADKK